MNTKSSQQPQCYTVHLVFSCKQKAGQEVSLLMSKLIPLKIFCSVRKRVNSFSISIWFSVSLSNKNFLLHITAILFFFFGEEETD